MNGGNSALTFIDSDSLGDFGDPGALATSTDSDFSGSLTTSGATRRLELTVSHTDTVNFVKEGFSDTVTGRLTLGLDTDLKTVGESRSFGTNDLTMSFSDDYNRLPANPDVVFNREVVSRGNVRLTATSASSVTLEFMSFPLDSDGTFSLYGGTRRTISGTITINLR